MALHVVTRSIYFLCIYPINIMYLYNVEHNVVCPTLWVYISWYYLGSLFQNVL